VELLEDKINTALYEEYEEEWMLVEKTTVCCGQLIVIVCWFEHKM